MKTGFALGIALAVLTIVAGPARATADGPDFYMVTGVAADDVLNIRSEPRASAEKIGEIPPDGRGLQNLGCEGGLRFAEWQAASQAERDAAARRTWCKITYEGTEGWVAARFLSEDSGADPAQPQDWGVTEINGELPVAQAFFTFMPDGTVSGSTGCNRFSARGELDGTAVVIGGPAIMTKMACPGAAVDNQEKTIMRALQGRIELVFDPFGNAITLNNADAGVTMRLSPMLQ